MRRAPLIRWPLTLAWTALVVYLMTTGGPGTPADALSDLAGDTDLTDALGHIFLFGVLAALWAWSLDSHLPGWRALAAATVIALALGATTEGLQASIPGRSLSLLDAAADLLGVLGGVALRWWQRGYTAGAR